MPSPSDVLIGAYLARYNRLRSTTGTAVGTLWDRYARLDDDGDFAARAARVATASQTVSLSALLGYLAALMLQIGEAPLDAAIEPAAVVGAAVRNGSQPLEVYQRGIITARTAIAAGRPFDQAMRAGRARAVSTAETDVALTQRAATVQALGSSDRVVGYRRVLTGMSCALCATASTQRYHSDQLMPIHNHCDCGVAPIIGDKDPGHVINKRLVKDLKSAGKATGSPDAFKNRRITVNEDGSIELPDVKVHEHGELGPVLTNADHDFASEGDLAA